MGYTKLSANTTQCNPVRPAKPHHTHTQAHTLIANNPVSRAMLMYSFSNCLFIYLLTERKREINLLFHSLMRSSVDSCMWLCPGYCVALVYWGTLTNCAACPGPVYSFYINTPWMISSSFMALNIIHSLMTSICISLIYTSSLSLNIQPPT